MRSHSLGSWLVHDPNAVRLWVTLQQLQLNRVGSVVSPVWSTVTQQRQLDGEGTRRSYIRQYWIVLYGIKTDHAPDLDQSQKFNHPRSILLINYLQICLNFLRYHVHRHRGDPKFGGGYNYMYDVMNYNTLSHLCRWQTNLWIWWCLYQWD